MHTLNRVLLITALLTLIVPVALGGAGLATILNRDAAEEEFSDALDRARDGYREAATAGVSADRARRTIDATGKQLADLNKKKRALRLQVALLRDRMRSMEDDADALMNLEVRSVTRMDGERERLARFARGGFLQFLVADDGGSPFRLFSKRLLGGSLGESVDDQVRGEALSRAQAQVLISLQQTRETSLLSQAQLFENTGDLAAQLASTEAERVKVQKEYLQADRLHALAQAQLAASEEEMDEIRRETADVEKEILRMQGDMAQIEARLRARAERELIQKGLRTAQPGRYREQASATTFIWPADGTHTAGFHDQSYYAHFGVPHNGIDIAVPQGTEVAAAADGIVFLARDGGARGFSYILIGHRGGYATLYGHLSSFGVVNGQEVRQGQVIGRSGGTPGTHGAGPMTTGAHLHVEVIKNGVHVDPRSVMP